MCKTTYLIVASLHYLILCPIKSYMTICMLRSITWKYILLDHFITASVGHVYSDIIIIVIFTCSKSVRDCIWGDIVDQAEHRAGRYL